MIRQLRVQNFESHVDSVLDLSPGLNVLVGLTDSGKSSLFRALKWLMFNRPGGSWMIPLFDQKPGWTEVEVTTDDNVSVIKRKKGSQSEYIIDGKRLTGFGTEVPVDVRDALDMDDVNFQSQIELPFLMFDSPGERSRVLNRVAGLEDIDRCLAAADSDMRRVHNTLFNQRETLERLQEESKRFADLDERDKLVKQAEEIEEQIDETTRVKEAVTQAVERLSEIDEAIDSESSLLDKEITKKLELADSLQKNISTNRRTVVLLSGLLNELETIDDHIKDTQSLYDDLMKSIPKECPACGRPLA